MMHMSPVKQDNPMDITRASLANRETMTADNQHKEKLDFPDTSPCPQTKKKRKKNDLFKSYWKETNIWCGLNG